MHPVHFAQRALNTLHTPHYARCTLHVAYCVPCTPVQVLAVLCTCEGWVAGVTGWLNNGQKWGVGTIKMAERKLSWCKHLLSPVCISWSMRVPCSVQRAQDAKCKVCSGSCAECRVQSVQCTLKMFLYRVDGIDVGRKEGQTSEFSIPCAPVSGSNTAIFKAFSTFGHSLGKICTPPPPSCEAGFPLSLPSD